MPIIGTLPNNIQNGQAVDANPVMADFNFIVNQVNANGNPIGTLTAPSGTTTLFYQAAAPSGWTISAGFTDHTVQVNAAAGGTTGGAANYSTMFQAQWTSDGHSLTTAELAAHSHTVNDAGHSHVISDPGHHHSSNSGSGNFFTDSGGAQQPTAGGTGQFTTMQNATTGVVNITNTTGISINNNGSGTAHTHTKTFNVNYVAMIMAVKT